MSNTDFRARTSHAASGGSPPGSTSRGPGDGPQAQPVTIARLDYRAATADRTARLDLALHGEIDLADAALLQDTLEQVTAFPSCPITVDLSGVTFLCSSGLNFLCRVLQHADADGHPVTLAGPTPIAVRALQVSGLDQIFIITNDDALGQAKGISNGAAAESNPPQRVRQG